MKNCIFVGVSGGSGSGKTTVAYNLLKAFNDEDAVLIQQDAYYKEIKNKSLEERAKTNFDHPDAIEFKLLRKHLKKLKNSQEIKRPIYDFTTHLRKSEKVVVKPSKIVIVEGILILAVPKIRKMLDMKIFVDTDADEMMLRRVERDIKERARTFDCIKEQYLETVKPMYLEFCEPSKRYADIIIPHGGQNKIAIKMLIARLQKYITE